MKKTSPGARQPTRRALAASDAKPTASAAPTDGARPATRRARLARLTWVLVAAAAVGAVIASSSVCVNAFWAAPRRMETKVYGYEVLREFPHDTAAFCQGLVWHDGALFESTGKYGESSLRQVELDSGRVLRETRLDRRFFGEGLALWNDKLVQLTWQERMALVYDRDSFRLLGSLPYSTEGWGLAYDGKHFILSDGGDRLRFLEPATFRQVRAVQVRDGATPVGKLNELEFVEGNIFANIWRSDRVAIINPADGKVVGWIDLGGLLSDRDRGHVEHVLNGIAYDAPNQRLFVTGKNWPKLFQIRVVDKEAERR